MTRNAYSEDANIQEPAARRMGKNVPHNLSQGSASTHSKDY